MSAWKGKIRKAYGNSCWICGSPYRLTIHHMRAKCHGGTNSKDNCVCWCEDCHAAYHKKFGVRTSDKLGHPVKDDYRPTRTRKKKKNRTRRR